MLKYLQERVNKATKEFDGKPAEAKAAAESNAETDLLSSKQGRVHDLMRKLAVKLGKENHAEEEGR